MNCELRYIRQTADGKHLLRCANCPREILASKLRQYQATCGIASDAPKDGPGTELAGIIKQLKQKPKSGCGCGPLRREMNTLGIDGCKQERERLAGKLQENAAKYGLADKARAALAAAASGLALQINWLDPCPGLIDEAIRRAEVSSSAASGC